MKSHLVGVPMRRAPSPKNRLLFALCIGVGFAGSACALTFAEALADAEQQSPALLAQQAALAGAVAAQGGAAALPDPRLSVGVDNLPVSGPDRLSLTRDFMTMQRIGLMQEVPNRAKREARVQGAEARAERERALLEVVRLQLRQTLARAWSATQHALKRQAALDAVQRENQRLQDSLPGRIAASTASAADLILARQDALALTDRRDDLVRDEAKARAALKRLVGPRATEPLVGEAPLPTVDAAALHAQLARHAEVAVYPALLNMAQADAREVRAESRGDWSWEVAYSRRGRQWGDMVSVQLSFDLPWQRRQLPALAAKQREVDRLQAEREDLLRRHAQELDEQLAELAALDRQWERLQGDGLRLAQERVDLGLSGYQAGKVDLGAVLAARRELLEGRLRLIELEAQRTDLRARLNNQVAE
nr:TolC family protein [uncultured Roseateles sp.]